MLNLPHICQYYISAFWKLRNNWGNSSQAKTGHNLLWMNKLVTWAPNLLSSSLYHEADNNCFHAYDHLQLDLWPSLLQSALSSIRYWNSKFLLPCQLVHISFLGVSLFKTQSLTAPDNFASFIAMLLLMWFQPVLMHVSGGVGWVGALSATEIKIRVLLCSVLTPPLYLASYPLSLQYNSLLDWQL